VLTAVCREEDSRLHIIICIAVSFCYEPLRKVLEQGSSLGCMNRKVREVARTGAPSVPMYGLDTSTKLKTRNQEDPLIYYGKVSLYIPVRSFPNKAIVASYYLVILGSLCHAGMMSLSGSHVVLPGTYRILP